MGIRTSALPSSKTCGKKVQWGILALTLILLVLIFSGFLISIMNVTASDQTRTPKIYDYYGKDQATGGKKMFR